MNTPLFVETFSTPFGPFSLATTETGAVVATAFGPPATLRPLLPKCNVIRYTSRGARAGREQVRAYCAGELRVFDLPLAPEGTDFQQRVWSALRVIPFGATRSYGELAQALRTSARAVGRANATNPLCLFVPCHRVIGADGALTGFAFGEELKARLLEHERRVLARPRAFTRGVGAGVARKS